MRLIGTLASCASRYSSISSLYLFSGKLRLQDLQLKKIFVQVRLM